MKCWVCSKQARGLRHADTRHGVGSASRYPLDWVFCSLRCQRVFHAQFGNFRRDEQMGKTFGKEISVTDLLEIENAAKRQCLKAFGQAADSIGFDKPLGQYSKDEAMAVIVAIVDGYTAAMVEHHEMSKYPPVRTQAGTQLVDDPFDGLASEPWEATP